MENAPKIPEGAKESSISKMECTRGLHGNAFEIGGRINVILSGRGGMLCLSYLPCLAFMKSINSFHFDALLAAWYVGARFRLMVRISDVEGMIWNSFRFCVQYSKQIQLLNVLNFILYCLISSRLTQIDFVTCNIL